MRCLVFLFALASVASAQARVTVGANVRISTDLLNLPHYEYWADAHSTNPRHMIACSHVPSDTGFTASVVYVTSDSGRTWKRTLKIDGGDPICAFGLGDTAFFVALVDRNVAVYRSADAGMTWDKPALAQGSDREYFAIDRSGGKYHGRIYINAEAGVRGIVDVESVPHKEQRGSPIAHTRGISLYRSLDGGRTFGYTPVVLAALGNTGMVGMGNSVVLSEGTLVTVFPFYPTLGNSSGDWVRHPPGVSNAEVRVALSKSGGEDYTEMHTVSDWSTTWGPDSTSVVPIIAADSRSSSPFKDRLYVVWPDERTGHSEIYFSYSRDQGKTWSPKQIVNDEPRAKFGALQSAHFNPSVAVNKDGVVGVMWYDRRDRTDLGWTIRFRASLDGGDSFTPSVLVSSVANVFDGHEQWPASPVTRVSGSLTDSIFSARITNGLAGGFWWESGHTTGFMANASGAFYPVWGDNRTGISQMWTAPVTVHGVASRNGSGDVANLVNLAGRVTLVLTNQSVDRSKGIVRMEAKLKNTGTDTIVGPVKLQVVRIASPIGVASLEGADNRLGGSGAILDLTPLLTNGRLSPKDSTRTRTLTFRLRDVEPRRVRLGIVTMDARILAQSVIAGPKAAADSVKKD
jgi:hypothetical protein